MNDLKTKLIRLVKNDDCTYQGLVYEINVVFAPFDTKEEALESLDLYEKYLKDSNQKYIKEV